MSSRIFQLQFNDHSILSAAMTRPYHLYCALAVALSIIGQSCAKEIPAIGRGDEAGEMASCLKLSAKGKNEDAIQCLEMFKARYPQSALGQEAELRIGDTYYNKKEFLLAAESYMAFLRLYPRHQMADYAHYRAGESYFRESPKAIDRDQEYLGKAIDQLRSVSRYYPSSKYVGPSNKLLHEARTKVAKRNYYIGRYYFRTGEYIACLSRFQEVADSYFDSSIADKALYMIVRANIKLGRLEAAKTAFSALTSKYPKSSYIDRAESKMLSAAKHLAAK